MLLHTFFNDVYRLHRLRDASQNTIRLYGCTIRSFQKYLKRNAQLDDLNDDTLSLFLSSRSESVSSQTCRKEYDQLTSLWRYANRRQMLKTWPDLLPPKCQRRNPQALTLIQLRALFIAADEHSYEMGQLVRLAWQTGERKSAMLAVRGYDLNDVFITFRAETRKGSTEDNVCQVSEDLADSLAILCKGNSFLFSQRTTWHHHFHRIANRAKIRGKTNWLSHAQAFGGVTLGGSWWRCV